MIEEVKGFSTKLEPGRLCDGEALEQAEINILHAGSVEVSRPATAERAQGGYGECIRIQPDSVSWIRGCAYEGDCLCNRRENRDSRRYC